MTNKLLVDGNLAVQVEIKNIINDHSSVFLSKEKYEIIMRFFVQNKLTNINVILTKLDYAKCSDLSIFDGEQDKISDKKNKFEVLKKTPSKTLLEIETNELIQSLQINKILKSKPHNCVSCKVTNAISPCEIWLQDIVDCENYFDM
jgi:hypothetical protein